MTWKEWASRNLRYHWRDLMTYLLSCTWAVVLFYLCLQILFHPNLTSDVHQLFFFIALFLLVSFVSAFIGLSHHHFYKERENEWELLRVLGMGAGNWNRLLLWENGLLAGVSIFVGVVGGVILAPLFHLAVSFVLFLPDTLAVHFSWKAVAWTVGVFALLFAGATWRVRLHLKQVRTLKCFVRVQIPEGVGASFSLVCLGGLWWWTDVDLWTEWIPRLPLIVLAALLGGYGLLRYGGKWIIDQVSDRHFFIQMPFVWLLIAQLRHNWSRDARLLTLVAWMMTASVSMGSVCFVFWGKVDQMAVQQNPWTIQVVGATGKEYAREVERVLADEGLSVQQKMSLPMLVCKLDNSDYTVISSKDFNRLLRLWGHSPFQLQRGEAVYVFPYEGAAKVGREGKASMQMGEKTWELDVVQASDIRVLNEHPRTGQLLVVAETDFQNAWERFRENRRWIHGWKVSRWQASAGVINRLETRWQDEGLLADTPVKGREFLRRTFAPLIFASFFLGGLFFLASTTLITFRLRQGVTREPVRWHLLREWGVTAKEQWCIVQWEVRLLFGLPWLLTLGYLLLLNGFLDLLVHGETIATVATALLIQTGLWWSMYWYLWGKFVWWLEEKLEDGVVD